MQGYNLPTSERLLSNPTQPWISKYIINLKIQQKSYERWDNRPEGERERKERERVRENNVDRVRVIDHGKWERERERDSQW